MAFQTDITKKEIFINMELLAKLQNNIGENGFINTEINNANLASKEYKFNASETTAAHILAFVDIVPAINYYGITELLDTIGEERLRAHLKLNQLDQIDF